jgi:hypothetical protein
MRGITRKAALPAALAVLLCVGAGHAEPRRERRKAPVVALSADSLAKLSRERDRLVSDLRLQKARLALADADSIYLVLDAARNALILEVEAMPLRDCRLLSLRLDRELDRQRRTAAFQDSLSVPFLLLRKEGTITEHPPPAGVDTTQAVRRQVEEERKRDLFFTLVCDRNLIVHVTTRPDESGGPTGFWPRVLARLRWLKLGLGQWWSGHRSPAPPREIFLLIDRADALAVYRAIPDRTGIALRI